MRSIARWVLPVLVGPSTAVTPAPGARPLARLDGDDEKAMISGWFLRRWRWARVPQKACRGFGIGNTRGGYKCFTMRRVSGRGLSSGTSPERIAPESLTPMTSGFVHL